MLISKETGSNHPKMIKFLAAPMCVCVCHCVCRRLCVCVSVYEPNPTTCACVCVRAFDVRER